MPRITKFIFPRDGINGMVQGCMVPGLSGILVIGQKTREVFRGGDRSIKSNYETVPVPELKIITPLDSANAFSRVLQQCFRDIKSGDFNRSLDYEEAPIESPPSYEEIEIK